MIKCQWCKEYVPQRGRESINRQGVSYFYHKACMAKYTRMLGHIAGLAKRYN